MKTFSLVILLSAAVGAAVPTKQCDLTLLPYSFEETRRRDSPPQSDCLYTLTTMVPYQKVPGGYLIIPVPETTAGLTPLPALLATAANYEKGERLEGQAVYLGEKQYTTTLGFNATAHLFQEVPGKLVIDPKR